MGRTPPPFAAMPWIRLSTGLITIFRPEEAPPLPSRALIQTLLAANIQVSDGQGWSGKKVQVTVDPGGEEGYLPQLMHELGLRPTDSLDTFTGLFPSSPPRPSA